MKKNYSAIEVDLAIASITKRPSVEIIKKRVSSEIVKDINEDYNYIPSYGRTELQQGHPCSNKQRGIDRVDVLTLRLKDFRIKGAKTMHLEILPYRKAKGRPGVNLYSGYKSILHAHDNSFDNGNSYGLDEKRNIVILGNYRELRPQLYPMTKEDVQSFNLGLEYYFGANHYLVQNQNSNYYHEEHNSLDPRTRRDLFSFPLIKNTEVRFQRYIVNTGRIITRGDNNYEDIPVYSTQSPINSMKQKFALRIVYDLGLPTQKITPILQEFFAKSQGQKLIRFESGLQKESLIKSMAFNYNKATISILK